MHLVTVYGNCTGVVQGVSMLRVDCCKWYRCSAASCNHLCSQHMARRWKSSQWCCAAAGAGRQQLYRGTPADEHKEVLYVSSSFLWDATKAQWKHSICMCMCYAGHQLKVCFGAGCSGLWWWSSTLQQASSFSSCSQAATLQDNKQPLRVLCRLAWWWDAGFRFRAKVKSLNPGLHMT